MAFWITDGKRIPILEIDVKKEKKKNSETAEPDTEFGMKAVGVVLVYEL